MQLIVARMFLSFVRDDDPGLEFLIGSRELSSSILASTYLAEAIAHMLERAEPKLRHG